MASSNTVTIANKKIIQPLAREPRPGLNELLAAEEAKFFFSSRSRHTRFSRDWSSDVCSSDLPRRSPPAWPAGSRSCCRLPAARTSRYPGTCSLAGRPGHALVDRQQRGFLRLVQLAVGPDRAFHAVRYW